MDVKRFEFQIEGGVIRRRLDDYLFARMHRLSRMYIRELVKTGRVQVNGEFQNVGFRVNTNDFVEVEADLSRGTAMRPESIPLNIVYEDASIIVVDKPPGMLVHPTHRDKSGTLLNALAYYLNESTFPNRSKDAENDVETIRPGLVHRLDRETSGLMVVAKSVVAHRRMAREFMKKRVEKRYLAFVVGAISDDEGMIEKPIGRYADEKHWDIKNDGKHALTRFRVLEKYADATLVELEPVTGRTNQLRIHCASIGHPIVGDTQRGGRQFGRLCLHASELGIRHPSTNEFIRFSSEIKFSFPHRREITAKVFPPF